MKTTEPKSPTSPAVQRTSTAMPFFQPKARGEGFFGSNSGQKSFFRSSPNLIQMEPSDCKLPKISSKDFSKEIDALQKNGQITEAQAENLMEKYGASQKISRCVRAWVIHDLKTTGKQSSGSPPVIPAPAGPSSVDTSNNSRASGRQAAAPPVSAAGTPVALPGNNDAVYQTIEASLEQFLDRFSNISVTVSWTETTDQGTMKRSEIVSVHPPYYIARKGTKTREKAEENREDARKEIKTLLKEIKDSPEKGGMGIRRALIAKASPEDIQQILQQAADRNLIPAGKSRNRPNSQDMQSWLETYGIGVDCSGFVSQAVNQMMRDVVQGPLSKEQELDVVDIYSGNLEGGGTRFKKVNSPAALRPGDTMHVGRPEGAIEHIRIITSVRTTPEGFIEFDTAESTGGGPGSATWRYEKPDTFRHNPLKKLKADQTWGTGKKDNETITYGRYKQLKTQ